MFETKTTKGKMELARNSTGARPADSSPFLAERQSESSIQHVTVSISMGSHSEETTAKSATGTPSTSQYAQPKARTAR